MLIKWGKEGNESIQSSCFLAIVPFILQIIIFNEINFI